MERDELIKQANRILEHGKQKSWVEALPEAKEFLRVYAGEKTSFFKELSDLVWAPGMDRIIEIKVTLALGAFIRYVENDLLGGVSVVRRAQIDVVSDLLDQANSLLGSSDVHPAAPAVLIGAVLEEFLRNWTEEANLELGDKKPGLDSYTKILREAELITKQDVKDIISWSGLRNHAAHGEWTEVEDRSRISMMLEGVNLFIQNLWGRCKTFDISCSSLG